MKFNKLALAAAIATAPAAGLAMEPMTDDAMSGVTGQDGISIDMKTSLTTDMYIHDKDGLGTTAKTAQDGSTYTYSDSGAIVIDNFGLSGDQNGTAVDAVVGIDIDAGTNTGSSATLNIDVTLGDTSTATDIDTVIDMGTLKVADSNRTSGSSAGENWGVTGTATTIMNLGSLTLGAGTNIGIQLGSEPQGHMIWVDTQIADGLSLSSFSINDANSGGAIGSSQLIVLDNGSDGTSDVLTLDVGIDALSGTTTGLQVSLNQVGSATGGADIRIVDQYLGASGSVIGDVEIVGLNLNGTTLTISGK